MTPLNNAQLNFNSCSCSCRTTQSPFPKHGQIRMSYCILPPSPPLQWQRTVAPPLSLPLPHPPKSASHPLLSITNTTSLSRSSTSITSAPSANGPWTSSDQKSISKPQCSDALTDVSDLFLPPPLPLRRPSLHNHRRARARARTRTENPHHHRHHSTNHQNWNKSMFFILFLKIGI
jgi:hypothetical protein